VKILLVLTSLLVSSLALATEKIPVSITLSGGVSLGAYQAGFLYYTSQVFHENKNVFEPKLITGASAGGLNTLLSILSFCGSETAMPTESPLWKAWINLKSEDLSEHRDDRRALVSRYAFKRIVNELEGIWKQGLPTSCDIVVGVAATRRIPSPMKGFSNLAFTRQEEKFSLRIRGRGPGTPPLVTNYGNALVGGGQPLLALTPGDDTQNFAAIRDLMFATSAFPLIFPPQTLKVCVIDPDSQRWAKSDYPLTCKSEEIETAEFVDGGILDNKPLGLADRLSRMGFDSTTHDWRDIPLLLSTAPASQPDMLFLYSDINARSFPTSKIKGDDKYLLPFLQSFAESFINSTRSKDSMSSLEQNSKLAGQLAPSFNLYPRASDHLLGFFGFFDRDFRAYDFYLGMYEAREFFRKQLPIHRGEKNPIKELKYPESTKMKLPQWYPLGCLISYFEEGQEALKPYCKDRNFAILAEVSLRRLKALCDAYDSPHNPNHTSCNRIPASMAKASGFEYNESDMGLTLRLLTEKKFVFGSMELEDFEAAKAGARVKSKTLEVLSAVGDEQSLSDRLVVRTLGPAAINAIERLPNEREYFINFGPAIQAGASFLLQLFNSYPPRLRLIAFEQFKNIGAWLGNSDRPLVQSLMGGVEYELSSLSSPMYQTRLRLLAGYQFHADAREERCLGNSADTLNCKGTVIQPGVSWILLERIRLQLDIETMPFIKQKHKPTGLLPGLGLQFYF